ncbi:Sterile alpha motif domain-containing protein 3 [Collichthys lucidus]|uniref:Sterile alpha motif domain-containing protein 3 n=1 Tax=Collichthys lucidus TaxID=240159 RepID=A0A4V6AU25_COLLU|nr:Sterile alpha motif domain-containing protein 3 [Collichthys lucidus]
MLRNGNVEYEKNNTHLNITRDMKHNILDNLASTIYGFKAYPNDMEIAMAAEALVAKHPCLTEAGSETGWNGWKNSIKFKMGNYRNKMRRAGCREVAVNAGKRSKSHPERESSHSNIKRPKRAEVNFLPNFPEGKNESHLEKLRQMIVDECQKTEKDLSFIRKLMEATFPLRRQTVVVSCPPVNEIMDLWPALKMESEIYAEYQRITNQNLPNTFYAALDRHLPRMMTLFRQKAAKTGKTADALASILKLHDEQDDSDEPDLGGVILGLLTFSSENDASIYNALRVSVVIEAPAASALPGGSPPPPCSTPASSWSAEAVYNNVTKCIDFKGSGRYKIRAQAPLAYMLGLKPDIIQYQPIGDSCSPLLSMVNVKGGFGDMCVIWIGPFRVSKMARCKIR